MNAYRIICETLSSSAKKYGRSATKKAYKKKRTIKKLTSNNKNKFKKSTKDLSNKYGHLSDEAYIASKSRKSNDE